MTSDEQQSHPKGESLAGFAHGRPADDEAVAVAEHLDVCEQCQQAVLAIPDDPLFALLCSGSSTPLPHPDLLDLAPSPVDESTPPELNDHPRYRLVQRLGVGGMGEVYKAEHRLMRRPVALTSPGPKARRDCPRRRSAGSPDPLCGGSVASRPPP